MTTGKLKVLVAVLALSLVAPGSHAETAPESGWYNLVLAGGQTMTVKILTTDDEAFECVYQGSNLRIPRDGIRTMTRVAENRGESVTVSRSPGLDADDRRAILDALEDMASRDPEVRIRGVAVL